MQRSLLILVGTLVLLTHALFAQNCPTNPTFLNTSGNVRLAPSGSSYALNNGSTSSITIIDGFSSTSTICVTNGSTLNLDFKNVNNPPSGGTIYVDATSTLNLAGSNMNGFPFTINNYGTVNQSATYTLTDGAVINNNGKFISTSSITLNSGTIAINNSGTISFSVVKFNSGNYTLSNTVGGTIAFATNEVFSAVNVSNKGTLKFIGSLTMQDGTTMYNSGYISVSSPGTLTINKASLTNYGVLESQDKVMFNQSAAVTNYCTVLCGKDFTNNAVVTNAGKILLRINNANSAFINQGTFINGTNGYVQGYDFSNNSGNISGGGNFYFAGTTKNQSAFSGSNGSYINFYDASPCSVAGQSCTANWAFDIMNTNASYVTKAPVTPITSTTVIPCGEPTAPTIVQQPSIINLCDASVTTATFSVSAVSNYSSISYQWMKNGESILGATSSSYTVTGLTLADTANIYTVAITDSKGTTISKAMSVHYIIVAQPTPVSSYLATGNSIVFNIQTSGATSLQWQKNNTAISNAITNDYTIPVVNLTDAGNYSAMVMYNGGTCISNAAVLKTSIILYSKATGNLRNKLNWGVNTDGSGSNPADFTRDEHTFVVTNRTIAATGGNLSMAGTLDVANANVVLSPGSTLTTGRIIRSTGSGAFVGSSTSSLKVNGISNSIYAGASDLYFQAGADTLQNLTVGGHAVTLHDTLNITAGSTPGQVKVNSGSFNTSDLLTLKSDSLGTAIVGNSLGTINGKVTVERFIPARRAWRIMGAPVTSVNAPTINAAWQEGATSSTDNPHPGFGTHITYGSTADGFDQNPQKTFSMYYYSSGKWVGIPATNKTPVTNYAAYLFFIRGDRSYNILSTTSSIAPSSTILRTTGYLNQGKQPDVQVNSTGFTPVTNPYASPIDFEQVYNSSANVKHTIWVWDPSLAGTKGVGAYVTLDWDGSSYKATPPSSITNIIQPYQAFFVQSTPDSIGKISISEGVKNITTVTNPFGKTTARQVNDALLEVNLKVFNEDSTTGIADGVLYRFNDDFSSNIDGSDINKLSNLYENLSILSNNSLLAIERRQMPANKDTLRLYLTGTKTTNYQLEIVPRAFSQNVLLYDKYLNKLYPVSNTDTTHITISINAADALSKAANRFSLVLQQVVLPVTFSSAKAYVKGATVQVEWTVANETDVQQYEIEKSSNGTTFTKAGTVDATGATNYSFNDANPFSGDSYYRIKIVDKSGKSTYTKILPVAMSTHQESALSIYPNPLKGKSFQVQMTYKTAGIYTLKVISNNGQQLFTQTINYKGGTSVYNVHLKNNLASGLYFIKIIAADGAADVIKVIVQ